MKKSITFLIFTLSFSSPLDSWIKDKSKLMDKNNFIVSFEYKLESDTSSVPVMKNIHYYSFKKDSVIMQYDNRIVFHYSNYSEIIDNTTRQRFLQGPDDDFFNLTDKFFSIFTDKNYKLIKFSDTKYLLSLNDYYLNINVIYNEKNGFVSQASFTENSDIVHIEQLTISIIDSIFIDTTSWNSYEVFDLR